MFYRWENNCQGIGWFPSAEFLNGDGDDKIGIHVFLFIVLDVFYYISAYTCEASKACYPPGLL